MKPHPLHILKPGELSLDMLQRIYREPIVFKLEDNTYQSIIASAHTVDEVLLRGETIYGVNTGFGLLGHTRIEGANLSELQHAMIESHLAGVGELLPDAVVRLIIALKINALAQGYSGVRPVVIDALLSFLRHDLLPRIPAKGSVGASGDLAPLACLSRALIGEGEVQYHGQTISAKEAWQKIGQPPLLFAPKEGLALINGTQVSTALALAAYFELTEVFSAALIAGCLSVDGAAASDTPFDPRIQQLRRHPGQIQVAKILCKLLQDSEIRASHRYCGKTQDPYSLRCQPQVMGACLDVMTHVSEVLVREANAVTDNPLVFAETLSILSGGNFHAESVAFVADYLALAIAEIGALSERRIALLMDTHFTDLPAFLADNPGLHSGFMIAHVTAASLASENKSFAHPASVDSLPTSGNQEDHVSMATFAARRLMEMIENTRTIVAIEWLAACQAIDHRAPLQTSPALQWRKDAVREKITFYRDDCSMADNIALMVHLLQNKEMVALF